jgi:hypothetical protein
VFAEGHEDAGEEEGAEKGEQAAGDAGDEAERRAGQMADLRLHALHEGGQIVVRLAPQRVQLPANNGPGRNRLGRGRDLQRVLLHGLDQAPDGVAQRTHQQRDGHHEHGDAEQHRQGPW